MLSMSMKALSLKQPFAQLIVDGRKTIELRKWNTSFRGEFYVHASKVAFGEYYSQFGYEWEKLPLGAIIGKVTLVGVKTYSNNENWINDAKFHLAGEDFISSQHGFILKNPIKFDKPIPCSGSLNFWNLSDSLKSKLPDDKIVQEDTSHV